MPRFLLALLLLATLFHTAWGVPRHAVEHMALAGVAAAGTAHDTDPAHPEAEDLCSWCTAQRLQSHALAALAAGPARPLFADAAQRPASRHLPFATQRYRPFASRDPPRLG